MKYKKNNYYYYYGTLALLLISFGSCNQRKTTVSHSTLMEINASNCHATDKYLYTDSSIIESYDYVALETTEESLLGDISSVCFDDGLFFVSDKIDGKINRILVFDQSGKFITQVGQRGNGEGEYIYVRSWTINPFENFVSIIDANFSIKYYDYSGKYLKAIHLKDDFTCVAQYQYLSSGDILAKYAINWKKEDDCILYTKDFKSKVILWEHRNIYFDGIYPTMSNYISVNKEKCYLMREFCDTVFALNKGRPEPVCVLSSIKTIPPGYSFKGQKLEELFTQLKEQKYSRLLNFVALDDYYMFEHISQYQMTILLWSIEKKNGYLYSFAPRKKEDQDPISPNKFVGNFGNTLIGTATATGIYSDVKGRKTIPAKLQILLNNLKENDNPVLLLYRLKD